MLNTNLDWYEKLTAEQVWNEIDPNYSIEADSIVYRSVTSEHVVMISKMIGCDEWCCEIESAEDGDLEAQGFGETAEQALASAIVECVGFDILRDGEEDNCEDASNVITREAYVFAYGDVPYCEMDREAVNWLMGAACEFVKANGGHYGIEWEEYRW